MRVMLVISFLLRRILWGEERGLPALSPLSRLLKLTHGKEKDATGPEVATAADLLPVRIYSGPCGVCTCLTTRVIERGNGKDAEVRTKTQRINSIHTWITEEACMSLVLPRSDAAAALCC